jgi:hypothetical protein
VSVVVVVVLILILLAAPLKGRLVIWVPAYFSAGICTKPLSMLLVAASARAGGFFQEEIEEFIGDGKVGLLLELLERGEAEQCFEERKGSADVAEDTV